jgi:hypothetical protein
MFIIDSFKAFIGKSHNKYNKVIFKGEMNSLFKEMLKCVHRNF